MIFKRAFKWVFLSIPLTFPLVAQSGIQLDEPYCVTSIAAASDPSFARGDPQRSGVYVACRESGRIGFFRGGDSGFGPGYDKSFSVIASKDFGSPTTIAEMEGVLYLWDAESTSLLAVDTEFGETRVLTDGHPFVEPSHIAVSPIGCVIVVDKATGGVFWFKDTGGERVEIRPSSLLSNTREIASVTFLSWNILVVLDSGTDTVHFYELSMFDDNIEARERTEMPLSVRGHAGQFTALAAKEGSLYIADQHSIYSYVKEKNQLIPASPPGAFSDIRQIAVGGNDLFVLDGNELRPTPKTIPVDVFLDVDPPTSQTVLMRLYRYLDNIDLLPTQVLRSRVPHETLEDFLVGSGVLIAPFSTLIEIEQKKQRDPFQKPPARPGYELIREMLRFEAWFCGNNKAICANAQLGDALGRPLSSSVEMKTPFLEVNSSLRRKQVDLNGRTVEETVAGLVVSPDLMRDIDFTLIQRFNKGLSSSSEKKVLENRKGPVVLPYEAWSVTFSVPVIDFADGQSDLWEIVNSAGIGLFSREVFTEPSGYSALLPDGGESGTTSCEEMRLAQQEMNLAIHYPSSSLTSDLYSSLENAAIGVGILEKQSATDVDHLVFRRASDGQAWHQPVEFDLVPLAAPASWDTVVPEAIGDFSVKSHHGTHVAALIGGHKSDCWSGLLPNAKLVLIDVSSQAGIEENLQKAKNADLNVFNISQRLATAADGAFLKSLKPRMTVGLSDSLFVVAAGNDGEDLNDVPSPPFPACWGNLGNVITVTAAGADQTIIGKFVTDDGQEVPGANYGKKYVDLVTLGRGILSATKNHEFGYATGTSQAAPLVTAAAAYLVDTNEGAGQLPGDVKARLIATAEWNGSHEDAVWGGMFNFGDAVRFHNRTIIHTHSGTTKSIYSIKKKQSKLKIGFGARFYERDGPGFDAVGTLKQSWILSLRSNNDDSGTFRLVYRDPKTGNLKIVLNADLKGKIKCGEWSLYDESSKTFLPVDHGCAGGGIDVQQITEYVAAMPYNIVW